MLPKHEISQKIKLDKIRLLGIFWGFGLCPKVKSHSELRQPLHSS